MWKKYHKESSLLSNEYWKPTMFQDDFEPKKFSEGSIKIEVESVRVSALKSILRKRRTQRGFSDINMSFETVVEILVDSFASDGNHHPFPSAGGLAPYHINVYLKNIDGADEGIYYFDYIRKSLTYINGIRTLPSVYLCEQNFTNFSNIIVVISCELEKLVQKYGDRGYRYSLIDVGHMGQNFILKCMEADLMVVPIGGFMELLISDEYQLNRDEEPLYVLCACNKE